MEEAVLGTDVEGSLKAELWDGGVLGGSYNI